MSRPSLRWGGLAVTLLTAACVGCRTTGSAELPARFPRPAGEKCRTEMTDFISSELKGSVTLVPETFTDSDRLLISRVRPRGPDGRLLDGRSLEVPEEIRLTRSGTACTIEHVRTGRRSQLPACQCIEMPP